ncbi:MAG: transposase, partial [Gammaproteobacteria bacterium]|nr:transposase [Gammaproteobacteria bacterium]
HVWHITHRCHKKEYLLKFARDRACWIRWLFEARKRYGLCVLNYMVTSNHVHLLVKDNEKDVIPKSMQLIAGRTAQAYNRRKSRKGAFWEDRYHAMAVQTDEHLFKCLVYIDLNMVRAGIVRYPEQWPHCGYHEIGRPPKRYRIIDQNALTEIGQLGSLADLQSAHQNWISDALQRDESKSRDPRWTESVAVGQREYVEAIQERLGSRAAGRKSIELRSGYQLKETAVLYVAN